LVDLAGSGEDGADEADPARQGADAPVTVERWWCEIAGLPARVLMAALSRRVPHQEHDGIRLVVADRRLEPDAGRFFARTRDALEAVAVAAPRAYAALRFDVWQIVLSLDDDAPRYQRFQLAAVVPPRIALQPVTARYAAWLLHTSAYFRGEDEAAARAQEFLRTLEPDRRARVSSWLEESLVAWREM
jgi:hypothetical protein